MKVNIDDWVGSFGENQRSAFRLDIGFQAGMTDAVKRGGRDIIPEEQ